MVCISFGLYYIFFVNQLISQAPLYLLNHSEHKNRQIKMHVLLQIFNVYASVTPFPTSRSKIACLTSFLAQLPISPFDRVTCLLRPSIAPGRCSLRYCNSNSVGARFKLAWNRFSMVLEFCDLRLSSRLVRDRNASVFNSMVDVWRSIVDKASSRSESVRQSRGFEYSYPTIYFRTAEQDGAEIPAQILPAVRKDMTDTSTDDLTYQLGSRLS
jgi:hypothetical protein